MGRLNVTVPFTDKDLRLYQVLDLKLFKGPCNSWRYGPELNEPKCWLHSDCTGTIEDFDMASAKCKGGVQWHEYENGKWMKLWTVRMYKPTWATPDHPSGEIRRIFF